MGLLDLRQIVTRNPVDNLARDDIHTIAEELFEQTFQDFRYVVIGLLARDTQVRCRYVRRTIGSTLSQKLLYAVSNNVKTLDMLSDDYLSRYLSQSLDYPEIKAKCIILSELQSNLSKPREFISYSAHVNTYLEEGFSLDFANLNYLLKKSVESEDYETAAKLRDKIKSLYST